jgi:pimeloyl-ACP methyl ester carboxylesterase
MPAADRAVLARDPGIVERGAAMGAEAVREGAGPLVEDLRVVLGPWGVDLEAIQAHATVWQGDHDTSIPVRWAELLAQSIPGATLRLIHGEGHLLIATHFEAIVEDLLAAPHC